MIIDFTGDLLTKGYVYYDRLKESKDPRAQRLYKKHRTEFEVLKAEYEKNFGPITLGDGNSDEWLKDPWPWDN